MGASNRANIDAYIAGTGGGKGLSIHRRLAELKTKRLLVWDARDEYASLAPDVRELRQLVTRGRAAGAGPMKLRFVPGKNVRKLADAFDIVCQLAFELGDLVLLAEELSDVTMPSYAPPGWRQVITQGRHRGLHVIGAAQRPALIDKNFLGNATRVRCGVLGYPEDWKVMAPTLGVRQAELERLESVELPGGGARVLMIERDRHARTLDLVTLTVSGAGKVTERRAPATGFP